MAPAARRASERRAARDLGADPERRAADPERRAADPERRAADPERRAADPERRAAADSYGARERSGHVERQRPVDRNVRGQRSCLSGGLHRHRHGREQLRELRVRLPDEVVFDHSFLHGRRVHLTLARTRPTRSADPTEAATGVDLNVGAPYAVGTGTAIDYCGGCDTECPVASVCNVATCTEGVCGTKPDPMQNGKQCTPTTGTNTYGFCESGVCTPVYAFCIIDASGGFFLRVEGGPTNNPSVPQCAWPGTTSTPRIRTSRAAPASTARSTSSVTT